MTLYVMEIRNTQNWEDVRYRKYTTSFFKSQMFQAKVKRIQFTDSGHGLVPTVHEVQSRRGKPEITILTDHVRECLSS